MVLLIIHQMYGGVANHAITTPVQNAKDIREVFALSLIFWSSKNTMQTYKSNKYRILSRREIK